MNKAIIFILILLSFQVSGSFAQRWKLLRYDISGGIGTSHYFGDIGSYSERNLENLYGLRDLDILGTRPSGFLGFRYRLRERWSVKSTLVLGYFTGNDERGQYVDRAYQFNTVIIEPSAQLEFYLMKENMIRGYRFLTRGGVTGLKRRLNLYMFGGVAGAYYTVFPNETLKEAKEPLTEEDRFKKPDTPITVAMMGGGGIKYGLTRRTSLGIEVGGRLAASDLMDGFAPPKSDFPDVYFLGNISFIYKLRTLRNGMPSFN